MPRIPQPFVRPTAAGGFAAPRRTLTATLALAAALTGAGVLAPADAATATTGRLGMTENAAPAAPTDLVAAPGAYGVTLTWAASAGAARYRISLAGQVKETGRTSTWLGSLRAATTYTATVVAMDGTGIGSPSATVTFTTLAPSETQPPTAPSGLRASVTTNSATLSWSPSSDNVGVTAYVVTLGGVTRTVKTTTATFTELAADTAYPATVIAKDQAGNASPAATLTVRTSPTTQPPTKAIYVSPTGSDGNPGTAAAPKRTVQAAVDLAEPGTAIRLYAGTYTQSGTIMIRNSGLPNAPIVLQPAGNGPVTLTRPVPTASCTSSSPARDRTVTIANGADHWTIEGLTIHNGIWMAGQRATQAYDWLTKYVNAGNWTARRAAPGHGSYDPTAARTELIPFLRRVTGSEDLDPVEGVTIRNNLFTGRGIYGTLASNGEISGNTIREIPCGIGPGIWIMTFATGWKVHHNDVSDIAISQAAHYMQEGIRFGSAADYNEVYENTVHDLPGDGRGINTDVDSSWNRIHHNRVSNVAIGLNEQMAGWGNRWEYNTVTNYRVYGMGLRLKDAKMSQPSRASSSIGSVLRCNVTSAPVGNGKALGVGAVAEGVFIGNTMPRIWLSPSVKSYWTAQGNTWNGSSALPPEYPVIDTSAC